MNGKRYIFYDSITGEILINESRNRNNIMPTVERVIEIYPKLHERTSDSYDVVILGYDDYAQDFTECNAYRVNPETKELEFSYPDPNEEQPQEPVYQLPLSEEVKRLTNENKSQDMVIEELMFVIIPELTGGGI